MPYSLEEKLVISIASSALFNLGEADQVFKDEGAEAYRAFQEEHVNEVLEPGVAFPFVKRLLKLNTVFPKERPVEVILLSRNSPETGIRVFNSIKAHALDISRAAFFSGASPYAFIPAFQATIFISGNKDDVDKAIRAGYPAGLVIESDYIDDEDDHALRLAFDFDGVLADDEAERIYKKSGSVEEFQEHEQIRKWKPMNPGPLKPLLEKISFLQRLERRYEADDPSYKRFLSTSIVTARNAPAHERMVTTLKEWGIIVDHAFFLGGIDKRAILEALKPHLFFDDQMDHLTSREIPQVHIPFGIANVSANKKQSN